MRGKILLVVGLGIGYVLGTRAGREKYDQMRAAASKFWNDPRVQERMDQAEDFVKEKAPEVAEFFSDSAKRVVSQVSKQQKPVAKSPPTKPAAKPATKPKTTP